MGEVLSFPFDRARGSLHGDADGPAAEILILPSVRIERLDANANPFMGEGLWHDDDPPPRRKRKSLLGGAA